MAHVMEPQAIRKVERQPGGWSGDAVGTETLVQPGEGEKVITIHARICDESCPKTWPKCYGMCKTSGDANGHHAGQHLCNTCGNQW